MPTHSKLAVILHADVVGSTALVRRDERVAHERIQAAFKCFALALEGYGGVVHELRGDALVAEFARASDAVLAALAAQQGNSNRNVELTGDIVPEIRIGVALGEVVVADDTLTGAGVVLAQRLEQLSDPGGVCISAAVREALPDRLPLDHVDLGARAVKGFDAPVVASSVFLRPGEPLPSPAPQGVGPRPGGSRRPRIVGIVLALVLLASALLWLRPWKPDVEPADLARLTHALPDLPSVAVLPFRNVSDDAEQARFAEGVTEDIITDLSKVSGLFVVARSAAFAYRSPEVKVGRVAEELGVRYVLEGSVRRSGNRIRITAQLVDALRGNHIWAERYDREIRDVFAVQSEVATQVVKAMAVTLKSGEHERLFQKHTTSIEAYDVFIRARRTVDVPTQASIEEGEALFRRVIELDPEFAGGYAGLSFNYSVKARFGFGTSRSEDTRRSLELANQAIGVDPRFGWSYVALGGAQLAAGEPTGNFELRSFQNRSASA
jgi:TolB-like protein/class 3 adenylate cyclase